jgi:nicotinate-nucleotide--dimethylbenzimidazole phosphoribosyltransferase
MTATDSAEFAAHIQSLIDQKTKPLGSLGQLEALAHQLCMIQRTATPSVEPARVLIFAADHGVAVEGVSLYPQAVTAQMVLNFAGGGAAISVFARCFGLGLDVIDVGVAEALPDTLAITHAKVALGSANLALQSAMSEAELNAALAVGTSAVQRAADAGVHCIVLGEMGIANTTATACLVAQLCQIDALHVVGAGTGVSGAQLELKRAVVSKALQRAASELPPNTEPAYARQVLRQLGGLEIAALVGAILRAAELRIPVLLDGTIVCAAALVAVQMRTDLADTLIFAHRSADLSHQHCLRALHAKPLLDLQLRLGEASGAALAYPLLRAAAAMMREMASFASAGVSTADAS